MTQDPLKTTKIQIGREDNDISCANDGSMVFKDRFVSGVRLVDLLNGNGGGGGKPSVTKEVTIGDWLLHHHDPVYGRDFWSVTYYYALLGFNIQVTDQTKVTILTNLITSDNPFTIEEIEFDDIIIYEDRFTIISSSKVHCVINLSTT